MDKPCKICYVVGEVFKCEQCGDEVCSDCIVGQKMGEDDFFMICKTCLEH
jgi:hypothetical protein